MDSSKSESRYPHSIFYCRFHFRQTSTRKEPFLYKVHSKALPNTKHPPFRRRIIPWQFKEEHNQEFRKKFAVGWFNQYLLDWGICSPTEIAKLQYAERVQNILRFYVSMHNTITVQISNCTNYLPIVKGCLIFSKINFGSNFFKETPIRG